MTNVPSGTELARPFVPAKDLELSKYCNWKGLAFLEGIEPPSWAIGDLVRAAGHAGMLYRSARDPLLRCLVLYPELADRFTAPVHDPERRLPRNAGSWNDD